MTYSAEFIINVGQYEHVKLTIEGQEFVDQFLGKDQDMEVLLGDYHASLKAAVLHGRDQAILNAKLFAGIEQAKAGQTVDLGDFSQDLEPEDLIKQELDAKVLDVTEHASQKPWERPVEAVPVKPWDVAAKQAEKPVQRGLEDF